VKRAPFLGASAAVLLAGCGGHHVMRALPGVAPSSTSSSKTNSQHGKLVPDVADAIPDSVLANSIIGEARRFDGAVAPPGWMLAQGQALPVASNHPLFAVIGKIGGGDAATFKLTNPGFGVIVAVAGMLPTSPAMLKSLGRHVDHTQSLGPNAVPRAPQMIKPMPPDVVAAHKLVAAQVRAARANPVPVPREFIARVQRAKGDARAAAVEQLSAGNRALLDSAVQRYLSGRIVLNDAVTEMAAALSNEETDALLEIHASMNRQFTSVVPQRPADARGDASRFLFIVSVTEDEIAAATARGIVFR
jgi:microcystin-dependent protein